MAFNPLPASATLCGQILRFAQDDSEVSLSGKGLLFKFPRGLNTLAADFRLQCGTLCAFWLDG